MVYAFLKTAFEMAAESRSPARREISGDHRIAAALTALAEKRTAALQSHNLYGEACFSADFNEKLKERGWDTRWPFAENMTFLMSAARESEWRARWELNKKYNHTVAEVIRAHVADLEDVTREMKLWTPPEITRQGPR